MKAAIIFLTLTATVSADEKEFVPSSAIVNHVDYGVGNTDFIPQSEITKPVDYGLEVSKDYSILAPRGDFMAERILAALPKPSRRVRVHVEIIKPGEEEELICSPGQGEVIDFIWVSTFDETTAIEYAKRGVEALRPRRTIPIMD